MLLEPIVVSLLDTDLYKFNMDQVIFHKHTDLCGQYRFKCRTPGVTFTLEMAAEIGAQAAGSKTVYELHGSVLRNYCERCRKSFEASYLYKAEGLPKCDECGGDIKPDVVLYEEGLDSATMSNSVRAIAEADMLIIGGTSLVVYPAAGLIDYYRGKKLVLINRDETARDSVADYSIHGNIGEIFSQID